MKRKIDTVAEKTPDQGFFSVSSGRPLDTTSSLELHIDELVLHGFASGGRYRICDAVKRELLHLFQEQQFPSLLRNAGEIDGFSAPPFKIRPDARPETIGRQVAQSIYRGLS